MKSFSFKHAGKTTVWAWYRYKAKESWFLARSLSHVVETQATTLILHNSVASKLRISEDFMNSRAAGLGFVHAHFASIAESAGQSLVVQFIRSFMLLVLPVSVMQAWVQRTLARQCHLPQTVTVFCDAHLAGFVLVEALKRLGVKTATLQHGLYRMDDIGSRMAFENFVADRIFLWDEITKREFLDFGIPERKLKICGQYGFSSLFQRRNSVQSEHVVAICPPYDKAKVARFLDLAEAMRSECEIRYSLHPILMDAYPNLHAEPLATMIPRPGLSICGDGGVIMDSLACGIPVISVGSRPLAVAHLFPDALPLTQEALWAMVSKARASYEEDLRNFGFADR